MRGDETGARGPAPPPLGSWGRLYALVVLWAVVLYAAMWWFTEVWNTPLEGAG